MTDELTTEQRVERLLGDEPKTSSRRCQRSCVLEELGLVVSPAAALLAVDWVPAGEGRPPLALFVFDGGPLEPADARRRIRLPAEELLAWRFAGPAEWPALLALHALRRLTARLPFVGTDQAVYLHHGRPPGPA